VNEEVVHGIPGHRRLAEGDIVKVDVGVTKDGLIADGASTFAVGNVMPEILALVAATEKSFWLGAAQAKAGNRVSDIGHAVQSYIESQGCSVVRDLCGHGVGTNLHEDPSVPNFGKPGQGMKLVVGMTLAIEPMVNMGRYEVETLSNGWTVVTSDRKPSAHYEHTVLVTAGEPEILTRGTGD
jgi:methionyl aminopeptidase